MRPVTETEPQQSLGNVTQGYPDSKALFRAKRADYEQAEQVFFSGSNSLESLVASYVSGVGHQDDWTLFRIRNKLNERSIAEGLIQQGASIFDVHRRIDPAYLRLLCPQHAQDYYDPCPAEEITTVELFGAFENKFSTFPLPGQITQVSQQRMGQSFLLHAATKAELYVHPFCCQLYRDAQNIFFPSASARSLSRLALQNARKNADEIELNDDLVLVQDRFPGANFAHFLFDWVTRIGHFCASGLRDPTKCVFVMGGVAERFQQILLAAVEARYGVPTSRFFFPECGAVLKTRGRIFWFSDSVSRYTHPAQMAHPSSIEILRQIARHIARRPTVFRRVYISRSDATRRRIQNEQELREVLARHGFEAVVLSDHSVDDQISIIAGAEMIVAPHGMGLTHASFNEGPAKILELFHPTSGTDAYALMSRAQGHSYEFLVGESVPNALGDFRIDCDKLSDIVSQLLTREMPPPARAPLASHHRIRLPEEDTTEGIFGMRCAAPAYSPSVAPLVDGRAVLQHVRVHIDTNVGTWRIARVDGRRLCTASCWIWIPQDFDGTSVRLSLGEWGEQRYAAAILDVREQWQLLTASKTSPPGERKCVVVLRMEAAHGALIYSTCWQLDIG
jgi:hypothetical protein